MKEAKLFRSWKFCTVWNKSDYAPPVNLVGIFLITCIVVNAAAVVSLIY